MAEEKVAEKDKLDRVLDGLLLVHGLVKNQGTILGDLLARQEQGLGFFLRGGILYLYVRQEGEYLWVFLDEDDKAYPQLPALTCLIRKLEWTTSTNFDANEPKEKLLVHVAADRPYTIYAGLSTTFSKQLLQTLNALEPGELLRPITLAVKKGTKNTVLVDVYQEGERIRRPDGEVGDVKALLDEVSEKHFGEPATFKKLAQQKQA